MASRKLIVEIVGDSRSLDRSLGRSQKGLAKFGQVAKQATAGAAVAAGAAGVKMVKLASDAEETASMFRIVFGRQARAATDELNRFSKATGTSRFELKQQAADFQSLIRPMGLSTQGAGKMSVGLTKLATDLASFRNTSVQEAMTALKSGLVGESEPLRRYGADLSAARVEAFAYSKGIAQTGQELTAAQKAQARYGIILQDTKLAQGDATRTAGSFANQFKRLKNQITDVATEMGIKLLPIATAVVSSISKFITQIRGGANATGGFKAQLAGMGATLNVSRADIVRFGQAASNAFNGVRAVARSVWPGIRNIVQGQLKIIVGVAKVFSGLLRGDFRGAWNGIKSIVSGALRTIGGYLRAFSAPARAAAAAAFNGIKSAVRSAMNAAGKIVGDVIAGMLRRFASLLDVAGRIPGIGHKFRGVADRARDAARRIDGVGEAANRVNGKKVHVKVRMSFDVPGVGKGLELPGFGGSGQLIDKGLERATQEYAHSNRHKFAPLFAGETGALGTAKGTLGKYEALGHKFGLRTTSGLRPGDPGYHGQNRARDLSNGVNTPEMMRYARHLSSRFGSRLLELIYTPLGYGIKHGKRVPLSYWGPRVNAMHHNHVHVAAQRGAMVPGTGSGDKVRALLEPGEGIINRKAVKAMGGRAAIDAINAAVPRFQGGGVIGTFAREVRRAGLKGRKAAVIFEAMLRANAVEAGSLGANPNRGDRDSLGVFQIRGMHGPARNRRDPVWSARWFINNARRMYRKGISSPLLAAMVERPQENLRFKYGSPQYVPERRVRALVDAFQAAGRGRGGKKGGARAPARRKKPPIKPTMGRTGYSYDDQVALADLAITRAGRSTPKADDIKAILGKQEILGARALKVRRRLRKINRAVRGKLKPATRKRLLAERTQLLQEMGSLATERGGLSTQLAELKAPPEAAEAREDPRIAAMQADAESRREMVAALAALKGSVDQQNAYAASVSALEVQAVRAAIADIASGQLAGRSAQRFQTAGSGQLARY